MKIFLSDEFQLDRNFVENRSFTVMWSNFHWKKILSKIPERNISKSFSDQTSNPNLNEKKKKKYLKN